MNRNLHLALLAVAAATLVYVEWHTDEVTVVLALLLVLAAALGLARPPAALVTGFVLGLAVPLAHLANAAGALAPPGYQVAPPSSVDWVVMAALVLPALAAAWGAAAVRRARAA